MAIVTTDLGKIMITPKGVYDSLTTYSILDLVTSVSGSSYLSRVDSNLNHPLNDAGWWQVIANIDDAIYNAGIATVNASNATVSASNAAITANSASAAIQPAVINNEQVQAETYNVLNARISALESLIANGIFSYLQADTLIWVNSMLYKGAEFFIYGTAAPAVVPDFIGQFYINTTSGTTYLS